VLSNLVLFHNYFYNEGLQLKRIIANILLCKNKNVWNKNKKDKNKNTLYFSALVTGWPGIAVPPGSAHSPQGENKENKLVNSPKSVIVIFSCLN
jgi:hypothetical protein